MENQPGTVPHRPTDRDYTVLVVPPQGARVHKFQLSTPHILAISQIARVSGHHLRRLAWIGGSVAFVLMGTSAFMGWRYFAVVGKASENTSLREENLKLKEQLAGIKERVAHISATLDRVKSLNEKLQNLTQLTDPRQKIGLNGRGVSDGDEDPTADVNPEKLAENLDRLSAQAQSQEDTLQALTGYFEDQQALLASAPAIWPAHGWVTSDFGFRLDPWTAARRMHEGLDIANSVGTPIVATGDGTVVYAAQESGYGNVVVLDHGGGIKTRYGHLSKIEVKVGERIKRGQVIAAMGSTGRSTGPHVHYEVRVNGVAENPRRFILESNEPDDPLHSLASAGTAEASGGPGVMDGRGGE